MMKQISIYSLLIIFMGCSQTKMATVKTTQNTSSMNEKFLGDSLNVKLWQERFENRDRDVYKNKEAIVNALDLKPGQNIADVGAGTGFYLKHFHDAIAPNGLVFAVEIAPKFIEFIQARGQAEHLDRLKVIKGAFEKTNLPYGKLDKIIVVNTYHHFDKPQQMLNDFYNVLTPKGELIIIDFDLSEKSRSWIKKNIHKSKNQYVQEISKKYFSFHKESHISLKENFMLHFVKK